MTKCGNFLCFLVQLRLKITRLTPIFVRLKATARIKTMTCRKPYLFDLCTGSKKWEYYTNTFWIPCKKFCF